MAQMLLEAVGDIDAQTGGKIKFYIDPVACAGNSGVIQGVRYNCYLRADKSNAVHLLFRVTTPVASPFPAAAVTPEGESYPDLADENALRDAIRQILQRERTKEIVLYLLSTVA